MTEPPHTPGQKPPEYVVYDPDTIVFQLAMDGRLTFDDTPHVAPSLSILRPGETGGLQVCLAASFYPDVSDNVILNVTGTKSTVISPKGKSYFFAAFSHGEIDCQMKDLQNPTTAYPTTRLQNPTTAYTTTRPTLVDLNATAAPENGPETFKEQSTDNTRLGSYLLLIDGLRLILTKILALNVLLVVRGLLG